MPNLLIYIYLQCVKSVLGCATALATLVWGYRVVIGLMHELVPLLSERHTFWGDRTYGDMGEVSPSSFDTIFLFPYLHFHLTWEISLNSMNLTLPDFETFWRPCIYTWLLPLDSRVTSLEQLSVAEFSGE